jgi:hypothetical protein
VQAGNDESLEATLSLIHRSRLEIEKAAALMERGQDCKMSTDTSTSSPLSPRQAACVHRFVDGIFKLIVQQNDDPLQLTRHCSRLEREKVGCATSHALNKLQNRSAQLRGATSL